jgi:hypothetical protein
MLNLQSHANKMLLATQFLVVHQIALAYTFSISFLCRSLVSLPPALFITCTCEASLPSLITKGSSISIRASHSLSNKRTNLLPCSFQQSGHDKYKHPSRCGSTKPRDYLSLSIERQWKMVIWIPSLLASTCIIFGGYSTRSTNVSQNMVT